MAHGAAGQQNITCQCATQRGEPGYADPVTLPGSTAAESDRDVTAAVRLMHRRRGWIWTAVISVVAWLVAVGVVGSQSPNGAGAGTDVAAILVVLLTVAAVAALVASVIDTVRLRRLRRQHPGVRQQAAQAAAHHPVRAHAYGYPPRHRASFVFLWLVLLVVVGLGVAAVPAVVNSVAYLAGAGTSATFVPVSYKTVCSRYGCGTSTQGYLLTAAGHVAADWPGEVPLGKPFSVRRPVADWGFGVNLTAGKTGAILDIVLGVLLDGFSVLILVFAVRLVRRWLRHRRGAALAGAGAGAGPGRAA